jgi:hypothetical protein
MNFGNDEIAWFSSTREGDELTSLQNSWRVTFEEKIQWLEDSQSLFLELNPSARQCQPPQENNHDASD